MSLLYRLLGGSFRGIGFRFRHVNRVFGRRDAVHEYPYRNGAHVEPMRRATRELTLDVFLVGDYYELERDALIAAVEMPGPGELICPGTGAIQVYATLLRVSERDSEGGKASLTISFIEAADQVDTNLFGVTVDPAALVNNAAIISRAASLSRFISDFNVDGMPDWLVHAVVADLVPFSETLSYAVSVDMIYDAVTLGQSIQDAIDTVPAEAKRQTYDTLSTYGEDFHPVPMTTSHRVIQADNRTALVTLIRQTTVIAACQAALSIDFTSYDEAVAQRQALVDEIDQLKLTASYDLFSALSDLAAAVVTDINARGADLSRIVRYVSPATQPASLVAHRLYGDYTRAGDIMDRNQLHHPLFVPGGAVLEVLSA